MSRIEQPPCIHQILVRSNHPVDLSVEPTYPLFVEHGKAYEVYGELNPSPVELTGLNRADNWQVRHAVNVTRKGIEGIRPLRVSLFIPAPR